MIRYSFPGFPIFLNRAATKINRPEAERPAHRITAFTAMANLCAQAGSANRNDAEVILIKASEFRDQLHVAHLAADLMLEEVRQATQGKKLGGDENSIEDKSSRHLRK